MPVPPLCRLDPPAEVAIITSLVKKENRVDDWGIFAALPDGLLEHVRMTELPQNTIVSAAGRPREFVGFVRKGRLKTSYYSKNGDEVWLETFSAGQFFAYEGGDETKHLEFQALSRLEVMKIDIGAFEAFCKENAEFTYTLNQGLHGRLHNMSCRLIERSTLSTPGRVCAELCRIAMPVGKSPGLHVIRPVPIFSELAKQIGTSRESISRTVSDLCTASVLERKAGALIVRDFGKLVAGCT